MPGGGESVKGEIKMKATGIVKRVDDLGNIYLPKEIRKTMNIKESDPIEFFIDEKHHEIILKKYE